MAAESQDEIRYKEVLLSDIREELQKVDSKASTLLATVGIILGALIAGAVSGSWSPSKITSDGPRILTWVALILVIAAVCVLGAAVKPRVNRASQDRENLYFFGHIEAYHPTWWTVARGKEKIEDGFKTFRQDLLHAAKTKYDSRLDDQIWHLSHIVFWKYKLISIAMWILVVASVTGVVVILWIKL